MTAWRFAFVLGAAAVALVGSFSGARAQDFDAVEISTTPVAPGLYMMVGRGGNLAVSTGEDGVFLVDDQYAPLTGKIRAAIATVSDAPIRFVFNTHWHGDHTGGNENLGRAGALIFAHDNVRKRLSAEQFMEALDRPVPRSPEAALPVVTFTDTVTFHLNGDEVHAFHLPPAHTDGDALVHFRRANVIHMGDIYFSSGFPFVDVSSGGSVDGVIAAVDRVLDVADANTKLIPGHGPLSNRVELEKYRGMLVAIRDRVRGALADGQTLDQVLAARPTREFDQVWGKGFIDPERFVRIVYRSLADERRDAGTR
jgi:glyoxylase-like metal-dependent hydrolase (beta-lactamase superfamily II)